MSVHAYTFLAQHRALRAAADFVAAGHSVETPAELDDLLAAAARALGFRYHALVHHGRLDGPAPPGLMLLDYPASWQERFERERLYRFDPVQLACRDRVMGFAWSTLGDFVDLTPRQEQLLQASRRHGLGDGFTVPIHLPGERAASCSFATRVGSELPARNLMAAQLVGQFAFEIARRVAGRGVASHPSLSPRQRECVLLMAQGKSDWEIARVLDLSEETVTKYLNAARKRFDVVRRAQLVVVALHDGEIGFEEVLRH